MMTYKASTKYLYSEIDSEAVILDINTGTYFGLNEVSNRIWQLLQSPASESEIVAQILIEYDVTQAEAEKDLRGLLQEMLSTGLIEVVNEEVAQVT
ncbi:MAG: PqqD family protein [Cyanobacteria bacterium J06621_12]